MADQTTPAVSVPEPEPVQSKQQEAPRTLLPAALPTAPAAGQRSAFRDLKLELTPEELSNPGTQKCVLHLLFRTEEERDRLKEFVPQFHEADKQAGILGEKLKSNKVNEIMFGVGVTIGGTIMGLSPFFYEKGPAYCYITLGVGIVLTLGATIGRIVFK
jgi:hypothetical protein